MDYCVLMDWWMWWDRRIWWRSFFMLIWRTVKRTVDSELVDRTVKQSGRFLRYFSRTVSEDRILHKAEVLNFRLFKKVSLLQFLCHPICKKQQLNLK